MSSWTEKIDRLLFHLTMIKMAIKTNIYVWGGYSDDLKITKKSVLQRINEARAFRGWIERCENGKEKKIYEVVIRPTILAKTGAPVVAFRLILNENFDVEGYGADFESAYNGVLRQIRKQEELLKLAQY